MNPMITKTTRIVLMTCTALMLVAGAAIAEPEITWIGPEYPTDLNADGTVIVGNRGDGTYDVFRWTEETGVVELGQSTAQTVGGGAGTPDVSDDGLHVSATVCDADTLYRTQGIWTKGVGWKFAIPPIPPTGGVLDNSVASCWGLSGDGSTVCGFFWRPDYGLTTGSAHANTWNQNDSTFVHLPTPIRNCRANDTNVDGTIAVGWAENDFGTWYPGIWEEGTFTYLTDRSAGCEAEGISIDEQIVYGCSLDTLTNIRNAAIWTRDGSGGWDQQLLGALPGTFPYDGYVTCNDITEDNSLIVGYNGFDRYTHTAFVWTLEEGMMSAEAYFTDRGLTLPAGYEFASLTGVSHDGNVFAGFAWETTSYPYTPHGFLIRMDTVASAPEAPAHRGLALETNYPNPFNPTTAIPVVVEKDQFVSLTIYDARGRVVKVLHDGNLTAGRHEMVWDGKDATGRQTSSGVYMARLNDETGVVDSRRMMLVK